MEGTLLASLICNGFLFGVVIIMYKGASVLDREVKMLKAFSSAMIDFTEEQTGKSSKEVQNLFNAYMDKRKKKGE
jgi:hypothetical protein